MSLAFRPEVNLLQKLVHEVPAGAFTQEHFSQLTGEERTAAGNFWKAAQRFIHDPKAPREFRESNGSTFVCEMPGIDTQAKCDELYRKMTAPIAQKIGKMDRFFNGAQALVTKGNASGASGALHGKAWEVLVELDGFRTKVDQYIPRTAESLTHSFEMVNKALILEYAKGQYECDEDILAELARLRDSRIAELESKTPGLTNNRNHLGASHPEQRDPTTTTTTTTTTTIPNEIATENAEKQLEEVKRACDQKLSEVLKDCIDSVDYLSYEWDIPETVTYRLDKFPQVYVQECKDPLKNIQNHIFALTAWREEVARKLDAECETSPKRKELQVLLDHADIQLRNFLMIQVGHEVLWRLSSKQAFNAEDILAIIDRLQDLATIDRLQDLAWYASSLKQNLKSRIPKGSAPTEAAKMEAFNKVKEDLRKWASIERIVLEWEIGAISTEEYTEQLSANMDCCIESSGHIIMNRKGKGHLNLLEDIN